MIKNGISMTSLWYKIKYWIRKIKYWIRRYKILDTWKYRYYPLSEADLYFRLSPIERLKADKILEEKGNIEYIFYPCGGIGWGVKVKVWKTNEYIDITDVSCW